jgi:hypothetical protein
MVSYAEKLALCGSKRRTRHAAVNLVNRSVHVWDQLTARRHSQAYLKAGCVEHASPKNTIQDNPIEGLTLEGSRSRGHLVARSLDTRMRGVGAEQGRARVQMSKRGGRGISPEALLAVIEGRGRRAEVGEQGINAIDSHEIGLEGW